MKLKVTRAAEAELRAISLYIRTENPPAALRVEQEIRDAFAVLRTYPYAGRIQEHATRRIATKRYPYLIYYEIDEAAEILSVLSIRHAARAEWSR